MSNKPISASGLAGLALAALAVAVSGALVSPVASASGFQISENTVKAMGRAYAGREAAGGDASVVINNPAAMVDFDTYAVQIDATAISVSTQFHGGGTDAIGQPLSGGDGGDGGGVHGVPAISFIAPLGPDWRIGFGVNAPYGLATEYDAGWMGRYQALKSGVKSMDFTGSIAWAVAPQFSLGFSVIYQRTSVDIGNAVNLGAVLAAPPFNLAPAFLPQSADGAVRLRGDDSKWGWQIGAEWKPTTQDTIGFSYHAKINHDIDGTAYFSVPPDVQYVLSQPGVPPLFQTTGGRGELATPATANLSYWHKTMGPVSWGAELSWTGWSSFQRLAIDFANPAQPDIDQYYGWKDTLFGSLGMDYQVSDRWTWRAGVAYDQTPTRDASRDPRIPDAARKWISLGATYSPSAQVEFNVGYTHLFVSDSSVDDISATGDHLVGSFENSGNLFGISMQYKF
ncbi:MAG TPA: outer membrane protein transport protein [Rhodanobacteraceae bacterium]|jgi:long-chain fatty acid transport protein|nr:outer membrane protein transport protein [Rhodanobacteraceae bacterium]